MAPKRQSRQTRRKTQRRRPLVSSSRFGADVVELGAQALKKVRSQELRREIRAKRMRKAEPDQRIRLKAELAREKRQIYQDKRRLLKAYGLYSPIGNLAELTPAQRARINAQYRQLEGLMSGAVFAEYPTRSKVERKAIKRQARTVGARITRRGIFLKREPRELKVSTGKLYYDKKLGLWEILVKRRTKPRRGKPRTIYERRPLAGESGLMKIREAIGSHYGATRHLSKGQRLRFVIDHRNASRRTFNNIGELLKYAEEYRTTPRARATFLQSLTIQVIEKQNRSRRTWRNNARVVEGFDANRVAVARKRGIAPYLLEGFEDLDEPDVETEE